MGGKAPWGGHCFYYLSMGGSMGWGGRSSAGLFPWIQATLSQHWFQGQPAEAYKGCCEEVRGQWAPIAGEGAVGRKKQSTFRPTRPSSCPVCPAHSLRFLRERTTCLGTSRASWGEILQRWSPRSPLNLWQHEWDCRRAIILSLLQT